MSGAGQSKDGTALALQVRFGTEQRDPRNIAFEMHKNRDCYFNPREANAMGNYFVWDYRKYTYPWRIDPYDADALAKARHGEYLNRREAGWPDLYFNDYLFDGELTARGK